ncbi:hypothetical protein LWI29_033801 [Acer saccharum]|uniref:Plant PDR ABC transporter associated domain-containing protein n=1 Tax=Acer saccharum TaxID=4024 RepID=A0AA39SHS6_ACESA|nr:hypothetical protein LWI29_033801 [Acer saccharum]
MHAGWEMGWIFVRSHVDLSYKTKFVATNAVIDSSFGSTWYGNDQFITYHSYFKLSKHLGNFLDSTKCCWVVQAHGCNVQNTGGAPSVLVLFLLGSFILPKALLGFTILFNVLFTFSLLYLNPLGKPQAIILEDKKKMSNPTGEEKRARQKEKESERSWRDRGQSPEVVIRVSAN